MQNTPPPAAPPRAGAFIVTIYGDVVEPRGGTLWTGSLIEACAPHGLGEGLVRTAISRLVASGTLEGVRRGRRSFYRLTEGARAEFARASAAIFEPPRRPAGWLIAPGPAARGWVALGDLAIAPDRPDLPRPAGAMLTATLAQGDLRGWGAMWELDALQADYAAFVARYRGAAIPECGADALNLRLRLIHEYRLVLLRDPCLPVEALPCDWAGDAARAVFADIYLALSPAAEAWVAQAFRGEGADLPATSEASRARLETLRGSAASRIARNVWL